MIGPTPGRKQFPSFLVLALSSLGQATTRFSIISDNTEPVVASNWLGHGSFVGNTNVEFTFVGSVGVLSADDVSSNVHSASEDLVRGVEELVKATASHDEAGRVSLAAEMRPRVKIITDIECPAALAYADEGDACLHFVVEVPLTINFGPEEYVIKDVMKNKFYRATNLDGVLFDAVKDVNDETAFIGIGKPGAGES